MIFRAVTAKHYTKHGAFLYRKLALEPGLDAQPLTPSSQVSHLVLIDPQQQ